MSQKSTKKIVCFGAGKIGRSFIGQVFFSGGYELVFVDIDKNLVDLLNQQKKYPVIIKGEKDSEIEIQVNKALYLDNEKDIISELIEADICSVSVGQRGLPGVGNILCQGLQSRYFTNPDNPLDIILAENLRDAALWMKIYLQNKLPDTFPLESYVGLIETSIGKMVPIMAETDLKSDPLLIFAEPYNSLIVDETAFRNSIPVIPSLSPKKNMKAWIDRKLFIHNLGHASLAYLAWLKNPKWVYTWEALEDIDLKEDVYQCMQEAAKVLLKMHPGVFTTNTLTKHILDLLYRFGNKALGDTIFRVGCDLERKLGPDDRLVPVIRFAHRYGLPYKKIFSALVAGIYFDARDEKGRMYDSDQLFFNKFNRNIIQILSEHCKLEDSIIMEILQPGKDINNQIQQLIKA